MRALSLRHPRRAGLIYLLLGVGLLYWLAWLPVQEFLAGNRFAHVSGKAVIVGTLVVIVGLLQVVFGPLVLPVLHPHPGASRMPAIFFGAMLVTLSFGAYFALKSYLAGRGYLLP